MAIYGACQGKEKPGISLFLNQRVFRDEHRYESQQFPDSQQRQKIKQETQLEHAIHATGAGFPRTAAAAR